MNALPITLTLLLGGLLTTLGCTSAPPPAAGAPALTKEALSKALMEHPDVLFAVLEAHKTRLAKLVHDGPADGDENPRAADKKAAAEVPKQAEIDPSWPMRGPKDAPITIVAYSDFECPYCADAAKTVEQVSKQYPGKVRLLFKHNPLDMHPGAMSASRIFEALARQSVEKAFAFHDRVFATQDALEKVADEPAAHAAHYRSLALAVGADAARLDADLKLPAIDARIKKDQAESEKFGFDGTPTFLVNGTLLEGAASASAFTAAIEKHLRPVAPKK